MSDTDKTNPSKSLGDYFWLQKMALWWCGFSLNPKKSALYQVYTVWMVFMVTSLTIEETYSVIISLNDLDAVSALISLYVQHVLGLGKIFVLLKNRQLIAKTVQTLHEGRFAPNVKRGGHLEEKLIRKAIVNTHKQSVLYYIAGFGTLANAEIVSLLMKLRQDDYQKWEMPMLKFGLFKTDNNLKYYLAYIYQSMAMNIFCGMILSIDLLIIGVLVHVGTQFVMLQNTIKKLVEDSFALHYEKENTNHNDTSKIPRKYLKDRLNEVVMYHQSLIELSERFESVFNLLVLTVFMGSVLALCFTMYRTTLYPIMHVKMLQNFTYVATISVQVFLYCYWGNELTLESEAVGLACYQTNFVGTDLEFQKDLLLVMKRSQRPIYLTAGKFVNLSLSAFLSIWRASYSYFMVLNSNKEE